MKEDKNVFSAISDEQYVLLCEMGYRSPEIIYALMNLENSKTMLIYLLDLNDESFDLFRQDVLSKLTEEEKILLSKKPKKYFTGLILENQEEQEKNED
jgi:hypothetical protein